jgi:hypothetical protein
MKPNHLLSTTCLALALAASPALAADAHANHGAAPKKTESTPDAAIIAKARATYPLKTCLVSNEALGSMGDAVGYIHRAPGQPDRVIFVCCEGCIDDFKADPAKFLPKVDAAAKASQRR